MAQEQPHALTLGDGDAVAVRELSLQIRQQYRIVENSGVGGPWKVSTTSYAYALLRDDHQEIVTFHWHPTGPSSITTPHVHIGSGAEAAFPGLTGAHIPTGRIAIEQFLRLIIEDLGVEPVRDDWSDVLDQGQQDFERWQTWR